MEELRLLLENDPHEVSKAANLVQELGERYAWESQTIFDIQLALEEVLVNVISYAFDDQERHEIEVTIATDPASIIIRVTDDGKPFNPLEAPAPDLEKPIEERPIGGLGIYLVRRTVDSLDYSRHENRNVLTLVKNLERSKESEAQK